MIYDTLIDFFKLLFSSFEFLKPYATTAGIVWLILKQHGIRKMINGSLPKRFRDTHESDSQQMKQDVEEIKYDVKLLKSHQGVVGEWSSTQLNGQKTIRTLSYKRFFLFLQVVMKQNRKRRMRMLTNLFKTSVSKKLTALLLGAAVAILNKKLNLDLTPDELLTFLIVVGGYIIGQSHVDAKKVLVGVKDSPLLQMGFTEAIPILSEIHAGINNILADVKKDDGSQAFKDAMQAYAQIKPILDALKHPEPLAVIVEDKVAS